MRNVAFVCWLIAASVAPAQKTTESVVTVTAKADKAAADGTQQVTLTVKTAKPYHVYANPVGNADLADVQTTVTFNGADVVKIEYPKGKRVEDKIVGDYSVYDGEFTITAKVRKKPGVTGPVEAVVKCQACSDKSCLPSASIKVKTE
jgi:DsbC/DsbD-like thiol-disulfide interchange protein